MKKIIIVTMNMSPSISNIRTSYVVDFTKTMYDRMPFRMFIDFKKAGHQLMWLGADRKYGVKLTVYGVPQSCVIEARTAPV
jgi:hypothetical protein